MNAKPASMRPPSLRPPPREDSARTPIEVETYDPESQTQRLVAELSEVRIRMARRALQPTPTQRLVTPIKTKG